MGGRKQPQRMHLHCSKQSQRAAQSGQRNNLLLTERGFLVWSQMQLNYLQSVKMK